MSLLSAEISATCNALGYLDEKSSRYYADSNTLETVKDIIRYLRRDDENHTIRRQLGQTKVLQTDLLPLLKNYHGESDLFDVLLRLIMNLTTPPLLLFNFEIPTDKIVRNYYLEMEDHLKSYKEAFVDDGIWAVFSTQLSKVLDIEYAERGEENGVKIERVLVLIRNILFVPSDVMEKRPDNDASIHDQVLWALHHSGLLDIILYTTTNPIEQGYYMYILEIMFFMLKDQQPQELAHAALERSQTEKVRDEAELVTIRNLELTRKQTKTKKFNSTRHPRFGGTFVVKSMKSISDNDLISHKPISRLDALDFDGGKMLKKTPKNRAPLVNNSVTRRSAFTIRLFLKEFCIEFLNGAYNSVMQYVKSLLVRSGGDVHDESYYFWALSFFMAFNRSYKFEIKLVSETLSVQTFHYVQQQSENYFDLMRTDRKKLLIWSRRLHTALLSYKELFLTLLSMDKSSDELVKESSKVIKSNIFYVPEYREFILTLLIMYDEIKMSDLYLKDLMETQHLFIKMFESFCKEKGTIVVQKKTKRKKKNKIQTNKNEAKESLSNLWDRVSPQLSAILESGDSLIEEVPFDAASDIPIDEQKSNAMKKIQLKLRQLEFESAVSILRAARTVWPENNYFGSDDMASEEEFLALRDIFFAEMGPDISENTNIPTETFNSEDDDDDEDGAESSRPVEVNFNFKDFLNRLPHPNIIRACGIALKSFERNSANTNHAILKLMHRIAFDCKMFVLMFQLSIFRTFQKILKMKEFPQYRELVKFSIYITRQFFKVAQNNDKVFIEVLFWKSQKDAYEIEYGYGTNESKKIASVWSEEEENELYQLFKEHRNQNIEEDVVDWILKNLINNTKSRRLVLKKLKEMDLLGDYKKKTRKSGVQSKTSVSWTEEDELQLTELYSQFKNIADPLGSILKGLDTKRSKNNVIEKMITLGLIQDKKELRKKRGRHPATNESENFIGPDFIPTDNSDSDNETATNINKNQEQKRQYTVNTDKNAIIQLISNNLNAGRRDAIEWLKDSIKDAVDDFEDNDESIPLVPLTDSVECAMDASEFQALLKALGISEPFNEQESYWRIPEDIGLTTLKSHFELLSTLDLQNTQTENGNITSEITNVIASTSAIDKLTNSEKENEEELSLENENIRTNSEKDNNEEELSLENESISERGSLKNINGPDFVEDGLASNSLNGTEANADSDDDFLSRTKRTRTLSDSDSACEELSLENGSISERGSLKNINGPDFVEDGLAPNSLNETEVNIDSDDDLLSRAKRTRTLSDCDSPPQKRSRLSDEDL